MGRNLTNLKNKRIKYTSYQTQTFDTEIIVNYNYAIIGYYNHGKLL